MTELTDLSETDASNVTITAIDIDEGCAPSGINNAIRNTLGLIRRAFKASIFRLRDTTDQTKLLAFDLSGITTATTRTITMGNANVTLRPQIWEHIDTKNPSGANATEFTGLSAYRHLRGRCYLQPGTDLALFYIQMSTDNGSSYDNGASEYNNQVLNAFGTTVSTSNADAIGIRLSGTVGNASPEIAFITFEIGEFNQAKQAFCIAHCHYLDGSTTPIGNVLFGRRLDTTARNALQFVASTGTHGGTIVLEGIRG